MIKDLAHNNAVYYLRAAMEGELIAIFGPVSSDRAG